MDQGRGERRLAAILAADVAGYTRLVEQDTDGTVAAWRSARDTVIEPSVAKRIGRIVKFTGDGFLAEFSSVENAVICAISIQEFLAEGLLEFRIGVHLGDVVDDGRDIHGEGVNIAARIEALADPGGINVSSVVYEAVRNRIESGFEDMGPFDVKHVSQPVHVYRVVNGDGAGPSSLAPTLSLPRPDKPSIVVLPFENMSPDPDQQYFADGVTEDLISALSHLRWLFVIARNSSFSYKDASADSGTVARELGVRYVLSGSIRRAGTKMRITSQLIDATIGTQLWADRLDAELDDVFALQDDLTAKIVTSIGPEMTLAEIERGRTSRPTRFDVWDTYLQALSRFHAYTKRDFEIAIELLESCTQHDPDFANAHALLGHLYANAAYHRWLGSARGSLREAGDHAREGIRLDPLNSFAHAALGMSHFVHGPMEDAIAAFKRAIELEPNNAMYHARLAGALGLAGQPEQALEALAVAKRGSPRDPDRWHLSLSGAVVEFAAKRYETSLAEAKQAIRSQPNHYAGYCFAAASAAFLGSCSEANDAASGLLEQVPSFTLERGARNPMFVRSDDHDRMMQGLRLAGVPE
ncbi:MAG: hypothetical protein HOI95_10550 [Chromatiales bacterium]|jgi:adenylate cyclase|nr:hypothetical protein [Chromatiales bacterium]